MAKFAYNSGKNLSTGYTLFELNRGYHPCVSFEENTNPHFQPKAVDELSAELQDLIIVCRENPSYAQKLQKQAHN